MYHKTLAILVLMFVLMQDLLAQAGIDDFSKKLADVLALNDVNEQKYRLAIFNRNFNGWLLKNSTGDEVKKPLKLTVSDDKKYSVFYYTLSFPHEAEYIFFVKYNDGRGDVQVHQFTQKIKLDVKEAEKVMHPGIRIESKVTGGTKMYEVLFGDEGNTVIWDRYRDLKLKCMFEELGKIKDDEYKRDVNQKVIDRLNIFWSAPEMFGDDFGGLGRMKTLFAPDGKIKICTYGISFSDYSNLFSGAVVVKENKNAVKVFLLQDKTAEIRSPARASLNESKWYGAIYLDVIEKQYQKKTYYTLLGYKGNDEFVKTRVVDVLWFNGSKPRFGSPVFKQDRYTYNRLIFRYSISANMLLRYDEKKKMIVMDNLAPSEPYYKGVYRFYGPDFSYNGYKFEKGKWILVKDIDLRNPK